MGRKLDMNFIGYTYKADVENEKSLLLNVLKELDAISETQQTKQPRITKLTGPLQGNYHNLNLFSIHY